MKYKATVRIATLLAALSVLGLSDAQEVEDGGDRPDRQHRGDHHRAGRHNGGMDPQRMIARMTRRLELDDAQVQQVTNIVDSARPEFEALRERGRENHVALRDLDVGDPDYGTQLQNLALARGELAASSTTLRGRVHADIHAILTAEQQEKMSAVMLERGREFGKRWRNRQSGHDSNRDSNQ